MFIQNPNCEMCKHFKDAHGCLSRNHGGIRYCHYCLDVGKLRPFKYIECPGFPVEERKEKKCR